MEDCTDEESVIKQIQENIDCRVWVVVMWMFTV